MTRCFAFLLLLIVFAAKAQEQKEFFDENNLKTDESHSLYYQVGTKSKFTRTSEGKTYTIEAFIDTVYTYFTHSNTLRSKVTYEDGYRNGPYILYYENGSLKQAGQYSNDQKKGAFTSWYPDGKKQMQINYLEREIVVNDAVDIKFQIVHYWDSLGKAVIVDGNGTCSCYFTNEFRDVIREAGQVTDGFREGNWRGFKGDTVAFEEKYQHGEFVSGMRFHPEKYEYNKLWVQAEFKGGMEAMYTFIMRNMTYPKKARRNGDEGSVFVQFIVERNGNLSGIEVIKGVSEEIDQESVRVVKSMPTWTPGRVRGKLVKSRFVLPIKFKLGS